jgi:hypothetical protein
MLRNTHLVAIWLTCLFAGPLQQTYALQSLGEEEFQKLHAELLPGNEAWKTIPWQTDLLKAQQLAAESKRPLFIWAMDGHPLGCT